MTKNRVNPIRLRSGMDFQKALMTSIAAAFHTIFVSYVSRLTVWSVQLLGVGPSPRIISFRETLVKLCAKRNLLNPILCQCLFNHVSD